MIESLLALIGVIFIGIIVLKIINYLNWDSVFEMFTYSFALGVGSIGLQLYFYSRIGVNWYLPQIILPWIIVALSLLLRENLHKSIPFIPNLKLNLMGKFFVGFLFILIAFVGFEALIRPVSAWDGWAIWLLKSKIFYIDGYINPQIFSYTNSEYPILLSLVGSFFYTVIGNIDDTNVLLLFFSFYLFLGVAFFLLVRTYVNDNLAVVFTFLLLSTQNILRHGGRFEAGQADLALAFFILVSVSIFLKYLKTGNWKLLLLLNCLLAFTALIKYEGIPFSAFMQILLWINIIKNKAYRQLFFSLIWLLLVIDWQLYKLNNNLPKNYILNSSAIHIERIGLIASSYLKEFTDVARWNILWPFFALITLVSKIKKEILLIYAIIFAQLGFYTVIYFITPLDPLAQIESSLNRLLIHITSLVVLVIAIGVSDLNLNGINKKIVKLFSIMEGKK